MTYKKIKFIGGGRWASIVLRELVSNFKDLTVDWYTKNHFIIDKSLIDFIDKKIIKNISDENYLNNAYEKIIIESHSLRHLDDLRKNINAKVPILIEKPIFEKFNDYQKLDGFLKNNIFLNLEFFNAFYLKDFQEFINYSSLKKIDIFWFDPLVENRKKEVKYSEIFTSIFQL